MAGTRIDQAFQAEKLKIEARQVGARKVLDELIKMTFESQTPNEMNFKIDISDNELYLRRYPYTISASVDRDAVSVRLSKEEASNYEKAMLGGLAATMKPSVDFDVVAGQLGTLMVHVVEDRII